MKTCHCIYFIVRYIQILNKILKVDIIKIKVHLKMTGQYGVQTYFTLKIWYIMIITCII